MAADARLSTGLPAHPKTKKLIRRLGQSAAWSLVCLILWAADNRSDGDLSGMSIEDIELASDWLGEDGALVDALVAVRFLDGEDGSFTLHDWHEHNPWAAGAEARSAKARWNAAKRHHGIAEADRLVPEYAAIRNADSNAGSNASSTMAAKEQQNSSNAPSPSPSPSPSISNEGGEGAAPSTKSPQGHALSSDWVLPTEWRTWALSARPDLDPVAVSELFKDHWIAKPGKEGRKTDWLATWRNWVRTQRAIPTTQAPKKRGFVQ